MYYERRAVISLDLKVQEYQKYVSSKHIAKFVLEIGFPISPAVQTLTLSQIIYRVCIEIVYDRRTKFQSRGLQKSPEIRLEIKILQNLYSKRISSSLLV